MLPQLDGVGVVALMRAEGVSTPVLFLTNLSGIDDRVDGLEAGGDDYLVKPFAFEELMARLNALARRPMLGASPTVLKAGDLELDLVARTVRGHRPAATRIPAARIPAAQRGPRRDAQDAARAGVGISFRSEDEHRRDEHSRLRTRSIAVAASR